MIADIYLYISDGAWKRVTERILRNGDYVRVVTPQRTVHGRIVNGQTVLFRNISDQIEIRYPGDDLESYGSNWVEFLEHTHRWDILLTFIERHNTRRQVIKMILDCTESLTTKKEVQFWRKVIRSILGEDNAKFNAKDAVALLSAMAYGQISPMPLSPTYYLAGSAVFLLVRYAIALAAETERAEALAEDASIMIQTLLKNTLSDVEFSMKIADCLRSKNEAKTK